MYAKLFCAALSLLFAYFQLNDPDPWGWVALYVFVAAVLVVSAFREIPRWVIITGQIIIGIWALTILPEFIRWIKMGMPSIAESMKAEEPHIEFTREFLGLALCGLALWWGRS